ncbi:MAG: tail fiber protein [Bacteroidaceae bacterium]|nr:tail fiber protein [Bacteroidaceae bacterium]
MKKLFLSLVALLVVAMSYSQNSGLGFNYQAVVRNADGVLLANSDVNLRISLYPGQTATSPTWVETHKVHTDYSGSFGITVGKGTRDANSLVANYADVNFTAVYYWMKIEIKEGSNYREVSYAQLPSSPYSEAAYNAILFPAGMIVPFAGPAENIPDGWMLCDGSEISRSEYANLYKAIGVSWGTGDGSTTFNLPDLRGMFLRGVSGDSGYDPDADTRVLLKDNGGNTGNNVGSYQGDAIRNITGNAYAVLTREDHEASNGALNLNHTRLNWLELIGEDRKDAWVSDLNIDASRVVPVGSDNRPKNVYVNYIIKY